MTEKEASRTTVLKRSEKKLLLYCPELRKIFILRNSVYLDYNIKNGDCQSPLRIFNLRNAYLVVIGICAIVMIKCKTQRFISNLKKSITLFRIFSVLDNLHSRELFAFFFFKRVYNELNRCFLSRYHDIFQRVCATLRFLYRDGKSVN